MIVGHAKVRVSRPSPYLKSISMSSSSLLDELSELSWYCTICTRCFKLTPIACDIYSIYFDYATTSMDVYTLHPIYIAHY